MHERIRSLPRYLYLRGAVADGALAVDLVEERVVGLRGQRRRLADLPPEVDPEVRHPELQRPALRNDLEVPVVQAPRDPAPPQVAAAVDGGDALDGQRPFAAPVVDVAAEESRLSLALHLAVEIILQEGDSAERAEAYGNIHCLGHALAAEAA